jgi:ATP-dependent RNA helicase HelY
VVARRLERVTKQAPSARGEMEPPEARAPSGEARQKVDEHPVHSCPDRAEHEKWAERYDELIKDTEGLRKVVRRRTETLARTFERVLNVLGSFGYVTGEQLTVKGERLCRVYNESDLLVTETMEAGLLDPLEVPDLAAVVSTLVYETRSSQTPEVHWPVQNVRRTFGQIMRIYRHIRTAEQEQALELCREPDPGFTEQIWWWAKDEPLEDVLAMAELSAGDFVRATKQAWDLLRQLADVAPSDELAGRCRDAARSIYRGVVAYSGAL